MSSGYFLRLSQFEGPLDLLLHLIRENEIDIFNIDISLLAGEYLRYLRLMEFKDLTEASDFLEMAASLIEIKSRMLLPNELVNQSSDDDLDLDDPRRSLQERLLLYEQFAAIATHLERMPQMGIEIQTNVSEFKRLERVYADVEAPLRGESETLIILFEQMLKALSERQPAATHQAKTHRISVQDKINELAEVLRRLDFALFQGFYKSFASRYELVVYIMAVLELVKEKTIRVYQGQQKGPLWIFRYDFDVAKLPLPDEERALAVQELSFDGLTASATV